MSDLNYPYDQISSRARTADLLSEHVGDTRAPEGLDGVAAAVATGRSGSAAATLAEWWTQRRTDLVGGLDAYALALTAAATTVDDEDWQVSQAYAGAAVPR